MSYCTYSPHLLAPGTGHGKGWRYAARQVGLLHPRAWPGPGELADWRAIAPAEFNKVLAAVRGTVREAWRLGLVDARRSRGSVDVEDVKARRLPAGRHVDAGVVQQLFAACGSDPAGARDAAMLALLYGGGLRRSEAISAPAGRDATARTLTVRHGKGDAARQVWLQVRGRHLGAPLAPVGKGGRITHRAMTPQAVMMRLWTVAERAGVRRFTPHDLRRSCVCELLGADAAVSSVQQLAGDANVSMHAKRRAAELLTAPYQEAS